MATYEFDFDDPVATREDEISSDVRDEIREIIARTYEQVWKEFYEWEHAYCLEEIRSLGSGLKPLRKSSKQIWADIVEWDPEAEWPGGDASKESRIDHVTKKGVDKESNAIQPGNSGEVVSSTTSTVTFTVDFPAVPPYEFCKYLDRSVPSWFSRETDQFDEEGEPRRVLWLEYCPFTSRDEHIAKMKQLDILASCVLQWEEPSVRDPDVGIIEVETVARLRDDIRLQTISNLFELIDEQKILPRTIYSDGGDIGILKRWRSREPLLPPHWRPAEKMPPLIQESHIDDLILAWCSICTQYQCQSHPVLGDIRSALQRDARSIPQEIPDIESVCGPYCALSADKESEYQWEQNDLDLLKLILVGSSLADWDTSCNIAGMIGKPCYAVHTLMEEWSNQYGTKKGGIGQKQPTKSKHIDFDFENWKQHDPCVHVGPCIHCDCAMFGGWCGPACRCSAKCHRRPRGCKCTTGCQSSKDCLCRRNNRECQPGICSTCRPADSNTPCRNNAIQRRSYSKTEVRRAEHGWGLFATEEIRRDQLIITYAGELYSANTVGARELMSTHLKRNYNFQLSRYVDIDGACAGNESRLINDARPKLSRVNCMAIKRWVAGDPHLAIVASQDINPNEELFMDYGETFWVGKLKQKSS